MDCAISVLVTTDIVANVDNIKLIRKVYFVIFLSNGLLQHIPRLVVFKENAVSNGVLYRYINVVPEYL
jgi:hypothetical protein